MFATDSLVNQSWIDRTTEWPRTNGTSLAVASVSETDQTSVISVTGSQDDSLNDKSTTPYGPAASVLIALVLLCVIVGTIVGNILVCVAVCLVRKLRRPCNYLLVSLAVSDLCVAILVMPVALLYEILGRWSFGPVICDLWVSFDVLSCTASILNLCMISVDRYYAITKPLEYGVKRTPRRMIACVSLVWLGAACISLPPLLILGNEHGDDGTACSVCQNFGYQIYATLGSFYIPLTVMIVVYHKIFQAARKIVLEERRAQSHLRVHATNLMPPEMHPTPATAASTATNMDKIVVVTEISKNGTANPETRLASPVAPGDVAWRRERGSTASSSSGGSARGCGCGRSRRSSKQNPHSSWPTCTDHAQPTETTARKKLLQHQTPHLMSKSRLRFTLAKERKASTTLGIIMSAFTVCWLPFFVLALVRPFLTNRDGIPRSLSSLFLWLGYANSLLNPIIYATLNKDFRKPFQQILYFRCSSLNLMMREEFYHSQYGDPNLTIAGPTTRHRAIGEETEPELRVLHVEDGENNSANDHHQLPRPNDTCASELDESFL
jgi:5-hydroxytryptamine receptor 7